VHLVGFIIRIFNHHQEVALLCMQHMVFVMHVLWLAARTIWVAINYKSVHLVGFIIRIYHDTRSSERQKRNNSQRKLKIFYTSINGVIRTSDFWTVAFYQRPHNQWKWFDRHTNCFGEVSFHFSIGAKSSKSFKYAIKKIHKTEVWWTWGLYLERLGVCGHTMIRIFSLFWCSDTVLNFDQTF